MSDRLYSVYILLCRDGSFYTGYTPDLARRLHAHQHGQGARYTRSRLPVYLLYHEVFLDKRQAMSREYAIKQLSRQQKLDLIVSRPFCPIWMRAVFVKPETERASTPEKPRRRQKKAAAE